MNTNVPLHKQQIKERKIKAAENACMHCLNIIFRRIILYILYNYLFQKSVKKLLG